MGCQEELLVDKVCEIYHKIASLDNLKPSIPVNTLFTQLVHTCIAQCDIDITELSERVQKLRWKLIRLCGEAEGHLESHFAALIASQHNPIKNINLFPYYSNYLKLTQLEFSMLSKSCTQVPNRIAFVGSGPLPLTSIILARDHLKNTYFHNYDIDSSANSKAQKLLSSDPDLSKRMCFHTVDIMNVTTELRQYDVVFLAALVGMDKKGKARVITHLAEHMAPGASILLRSAHGARAFLYPVIDPIELLGFEALSIYHPKDEVINSVIIARKVPRPVHSLNQGICSTILPSKCSNIQDFKLLNHGNRIDELTIDEQLS